MISPKGFPDRYPHDAQAFPQQGEDEIVRGFCDRCCRNRKLARYHRQWPPPERFTALCQPCLRELLALAVMGEE